ncbi:hypothetical protein [Terrisporobacter petrolearius]|uniref:hypothetical protein n=1 Tax=Terrisporobacter petrolearius TaxID=1460447 RepID=UPI002F3EF50B
MLLVYISVILTTLLWIASLFGIKDASPGYTLSIAIILWFTVIFANLRKMGIKTIMITGDNPLTTAAISAEAVVDDFLAEATPKK